MIDLEAFNKLRREADTARRKADEAQGAARQVLAQLKERGLKSIADAEKKKAEVDEVIAGLEQEFAAGLKSYREKFDAR